MKKLILITLIATVSCTERLSYDVVNNNEEMISIFTKADVAVHGQNIGKHFVSSTLAEKIAHSELRGRKTKKITPINKDNAILLYVINLDDGWAIVSADDRAKNMILAYGETGYFDVDAINQELAFWLEMTESYVASLSEIEEPEQPAMDRIGVPDYYWVRLQVGSDTVRTYAHVNHLLNTRWAQGHPWNSKCPIYSPTGARCVTGCVAVATAQILYYLNRNKAFPIGLYHAITPYFSTHYIGGRLYYYINSITRGNYNNPSNRWVGMAKNRNESNSSYVADLMVDIGEHVGMNYSSSESGTSDYWSAFQHYGVIADTAGYNFSIVKNALDNELPVLIAGGQANNSGHAWIIDGYHEDNRTITYIYRWYMMSSDSLQYYVGQYDYCLTEEQKQVIAPDANEEDLIYERNIYNNEYLLMNWGWEASDQNDYDAGHYSINLGNIPYNRSPKIVYNFRH